MTLEQGKELVQQHNVEDQRKRIVKVQIPNKKESALRAFPPVYKPNHKKLYTPNEISLQNKIPSFDPSHKGKHHTGKKGTRFYSTVSNLNPNARSYKGKEVVSRQTPITMIDLNKQENTYNGNGLAAMHTPASVLDLFRNEASFISKQPTDKSKAPIFDLNQRLVSY